MKSSFILAILLFLALSLIGSKVFSQAQTPEKVIEVIARPIIQDSLTGLHFPDKTLETDKEIPPPPELGGPKTKGILCEVKIENRCGYGVNVYIDGALQGSIPAWGDALYRNISGYTAVYCISTGRTYEWSAKGDCDGNYTFKLTKESSEK